MRITAERRSPLGIRWRSKEASPAAVGPLAAPERPVRRRLGLVERDRLHLEQVIAVHRQTDALAGNDEAVPFAAAPFAGSVAQSPSGNPTVMGRGVGGDQKEGRESERKPRIVSEHRSPLW